MKRRNFIGLSSLLTAGLMIPLTSCGSNDSDVEFLLSRPLMLSNFLDEDGILKIGTEYIKLNSVENSADVLQEALVNSFDINKDMNNLYGIIDLQIEKDFTEHDLLLLNGWVISRTEARQCALFTLI